jgi:hypothetical protein
MDGESILFTAPFFGAVTSNYLIYFNDFLSPVVNSYIAGDFFSDYPTPAREFSGIARYPDGRFIVSSNDFGNGSVGIDLINTFFSNDNPVSFGFLTPHD